MMLNEVCLHVKNFFDKGQPKIYGSIVIEDNHITNMEFLHTIKRGQYYRIIGSINNDGVYCYNDETLLVNESFEGAIWFMAVPVAFEKLVKDIEKWEEQYGSNANSPYQSESFGGYSYSKASGKDGGNITWEDAFNTRLNTFRRIRI